MPLAGFPAGPRHWRTQLSGVKPMAVNDRSPIYENANFQALVRERTSFGWILTIIMLVIYYGFILLVAFGKDFLATKIGGGVTTVGMVIALLVILSAVVLTGIYTFRANSRYDDLAEQLRKDLLK
jgi:uncharacterized membrane protein (DUF485 family)